jgi:hypothetical protein
MEIFAFSQGSTHSLKGKFVSPHSYKQMKKNIHVQGRRLVGVKRFSLLIRQRDSNRDQSR